MKDKIVSVLVYLATNKKARAAEWAFVGAVIEAIRAASGHP